MIQEREREAKALAEKNNQELLLQEGGQLSDQQADPGAVGGGLSLKPIH